MKKSEFSKNIWMKNNSKVLTDNAKTSLSRYTELNFIHTS